MKVSDYRNLIDGLWQAITSLKSCQDNEVDNETKWVQKTFDELKNATCKTKSARDEERAAYTLKYAIEVVKGRNPDYSLENATQSI